MLSVVQRRDENSGIASISAGHSRSATTVGINVVDSE